MSVKMGTDEHIRVLVVDDHLVVRERLRLLLETDAHMTLVGEAANGAAAVKQVDELQPDVVLMDLRMPGMDGIAAIQEIRARWPAVAVVILTTYNEDALMVAGLRAGARGYLLKDTTRERLFATITAAARGDTLLEPAIISRVLELTTAAELSTARSDIAPLTERERHVLEGIIRGERSKEIAVRLAIAERTVKAHLASIYDKLGVDSRAGAVAVALQRGLMESGQLEKR
jgi:NarL family two-component system response regulator YdfI